MILYSNQNGKPDNLRLGSIFRETLISDDIAPYFKGNFWKNKKKGEADGGFYAKSVL
jgi:hypothetical protein